MSPLTRAHHDLAHHMLGVRGELARGRAHVDRALATAERLGNPGEVAFVLGLRGWLQFLSGDWGRARTDLERAVAACRELDRSWYWPYPVVFLAGLYLAEGDRATAITVGTEAAALASQNADLQALRWASAVLAEGEVAGGQPEAAVARLTPLLDRPGLEEFDVTMLLPVLAWARLELGQLDQADETVERAPIRARRESNQLILVEALRIQALLALRQGHWSNAPNALEEGIALAHRMPYPYAEGRLLHVYGEMHLRKGETALGRERLDQALVLLQRLRSGSIAARPLSPISSEV